MEKKLVNAQALNIDGTAVEAAMKAYMEDKKTENMAAFIQALTTSRFLVPVEFPKKMGEELMEKLKKGEKVTPQELPRMVPILMTNKNGDHFAPAFTSKEQLPKDHKFMAIMPVSFKEVLRVAQVKEYKIKGILMNPNTTNLILGGKMMEMLDQVFKGESIQEVLDKSGYGKVQKQKITMTVEQFHSFARKNVELGVIPRLAFQDKKKFLDTLDAKKNAFLCELYKGMYKANVAFPYTEKDFDIMALEIREDLTIVSLGLPSEHLTEGGASSAYLVWNPQTEEMQYYVIDHIKGKETANLGQVTPDGKYSVISDAPSPGSEMFAIIEMLDKREEEQIGITS